MASTENDHNSGAPFPSPAPSPPNYTTVGYAIPGSSPPAKVAKRAITKAGKKTTIGPRERPRTWPTFQSDRVMRPRAPHITKPEVRTTKLPVRSKKTILKKSSPKLTFDKEVMNAARILMKLHEEGRKMVKENAGNEHQGGGLDTIIDNTTLSRAAAELPHSRV